MKNTNNIWKSGVLGVVVGDALGCPVQFMSRAQVAQKPVTGMRGHGTFNLPAGSWTDDSSLTLALMDSIRRVGGIDCRDIMGNFVDWLDDGLFTPYGYAYDVGITTSDAIYRYKKNGDPLRCGSGDVRDNGNGSLMRILPAALYCVQNGLDDAEAIDIIHRVGSLTHAHIRANIACGLYYFMVRAILEGEGPLARRMQTGLDRGFAWYGKAIDDYDEVAPYERLFDLDLFAQCPEEDISGSGYVVSTLEAAVWCLITTDSFESALLKAVNLGEDTDTVGAVAGGLGGLYYGFEAIPGEWVEALQRRDWIEELCERMEGVGGK